MTRPVIPSDDFDSRRYGLRLQSYLLALKSVKGFPALKEFLPILREAFRSAASFSIDVRDGRLYWCDNKEKIDVRTIPEISSKVQDLIESRDPFVTQRHAPSSILFGEKAHELLDILKVQSLLVGHVEVSDKRYLLGVCDGGFEPEAYTGEDKGFFGALLKIWETGYKQAEIAHKAEDYLWARLKGEWDYLAHSSKDCFQGIEYTSQQVIEDVARRFCRMGVAKHFYRPRQRYSDNLLADYLDAELSQLLGDSRAQNGSMKEQSSSQTPLDRLLNLCAVDFRAGELHVLMGSQQGGRLADWPRSTALIARLCMFGGLQKNNMRVPRMPAPAGANGNGVSGASGFPGRNLSDLDAASLFWRLPQALIENVGRQEIEKGCEEVSGKTTRAIPEHLIDWLRTTWQLIFYLTRTGLDRVQQDLEVPIDALYQLAYEATLRVLRVRLSGAFGDQGNLHIDSDWLCIWSTVNTLLSGATNTYYRLAPGNVVAGASLMAKMRYLMHLSHQVLYALHCVRHDQRMMIFDDKHRQEFRRPPFADVPLQSSPPALSESLIFVLAEYAYREIGIPREFDIYERLTRQLQHELPLYALSNYYRDHLYHVIDVCLLGELLLRCYLVEDDKVELLGEYLARFAGDLDLEALLRNWYIAALYHDIAYLVERIDDFMRPISPLCNGKLKTFKQSLENAVHEGKDSISRLLKEYCDENMLFPAEMKATVGKAEPIDHGVISCLHLHQWFGEVTERPQDFVHALVAVFRHNLPEQEIEDIRKEPVTLLLMLCDHLQEWGRSRVGPNILAQKVMEALRFARGLDIKQTVRARELVIAGLSVYNPGEAAGLEDLCNDCQGRDVCRGKPLCFGVRICRGETPRLHFVIPHTEATQGDFAPGVSWLLFCRDLQCINTKGFAEFSVVLEHQPSRVWYAFPEHASEMEILREYANTGAYNADGGGRKTASYISSWIEYALQGERGIRYQYDQKEGKESLTIELHNLQRLLSHGLDDGLWKTFYDWKWQWLEHRYIAQSFPWYPR